MIKIGDFTINRIKSIVNLNCKEIMIFDGTNSEIQEIFSFLFEVKESSECLYLFDLKEGIHEIR